MRTVASPQNKVKTERWVENSSWHPSPPLSELSAKSYLQPLPVPPSPLRCFEAVSIFSLSASGRRRVEPTDQSGILCRLLDWRHRQGSALRLSPGHEELNVTARWVQAGLISTSTVRVCREKTLHHRDSLILPQVHVPHTRPVQNEITRVSAPHWARDTWQALKMRRVKMSGPLAALKRWDPIDNYRVTHRVATVCLARIEPSVSMLAWENKASKMSWKSFCKQVLHLNDKSFFCVIISTC